MIRAVLDANVFVSAVLSKQGIPGKILAAWGHERFELAISQAILSEIERVLSYPRIARRHGWSERETALFLSDFARLAILTPGEMRLNAIRNDESDNRYLECAVEGEAGFIVSGDADLLDLRLFEGIRLVTPAAFWEILNTQQAR